MDIMKQLDEEILQTLEIRVAQADDYNFILNSWLKSAKKYHKTDGKIYYKYYTKQVTNILSNCQALVVCQKEYPDIIIGYIIYENVSPSLVAIHYSYTKELWRRRGIAQMLLNSLITPDALFLTTFCSPAAKKYLNDRYKGHIYNPYILEGVSL